MNNLYRINFRRVWPFISEAKKTLLNIQNEKAARVLTEVRACQYCKKYGLYDDDENTFGEFNSRGTYIDHRSARMENQTRKMTADDYDDMDGDFDAPPRRSFKSGPRYGEKRPNNFSRRSFEQDASASYDDMDEDYDFTSKKSFSSGPRNGDRRPNSFSQRSFGQNSLRDADSAGDGYNGPASRSFNSRPQHMDRQSYNSSRRSLGGRPFSRDNSNSFYEGSGNNIGIQPLKHEDLPAIEKNFYKQHSDVTARSSVEVDEYRKSLSVTVKGSDIPKPITAFHELCISETLMQTIEQHNFSSPTTIQSQGWPIALSGRDMIGISQTGSGKTLAFILPAMVHIMNQKKPDVRPYENAPQALVLAPTRELAQQIHGVSNNFRHVCGIYTSCAFGGAARGPQLSRMRGAQVCVATPGRLIDFVQEGCVNLNHCTYLVLDEADRMLDMGFEPQIRQIINQTRSDRQTLMWSATWPKEVQSLAAEFLSDYIQVTIGSEDLTANPNILQNIYVVGVGEKQARLLDLLESIKKENSKALVFTQMKRTVDFLAGQLNHLGVLAMSIHGDISQSRRDRVLNTFRNQSSGVLIATDVAARGLDVNDIQHIINYDLPSNIGDYIHRIGRTARGSKTGTAHSFFTPEDAGLARDLVKVLEKAGQHVTPKLAEIAQGNHWSRRDNFNPYRKRTGGGFHGFGRSY